MMQHGSSTRKQIAIAALNKALFIPKKKLIHSLDVGIGGVLFFSFLPSCLCSLFQVKNK
jgi:hypothetical protein